jgi:hypothetical protein
MELRARHSCTLFILLVMQVMQVLLRECLALLQHEQCFGNVQVPENVCANLFVVDPIDLLITIANQEENKLVLLKHFFSFLMPFVLSPVASFLIKINQELWTL